MFDWNITLLLGSRSVPWPRGMSEEENYWKSTGNKFMEKALGFSYEFDKEGQGWWIYFLPN